jgi:hypothetical protein
MFAFGDSKGCQKQRPSPRGTRRAVPSYVPCASRADATDVPLLAIHPGATRPGSSSCKTAPLLPDAFIGLRLFPCCAIEGLRCFSRYSVTVRAYCNRHTDPRDKGLDATGNRVKRVGRAPMRQTHAGAGHPACSQDALRTCCISQNAVVKYLPNAAPACGLHPVGSGARAPVATFQYFRNECTAERINRGETAIRPSLCDLE